MISSIGAPAAGRPVSSSKTNSPFKAASSSQTAERNAVELIGAIFVTSVCVHLLAVSITGFGIHPDPVRKYKVEAPPTRVLEEVKLEPPPPPPPEAAPPPPEALPDLSAPTEAANIDLPPLPATEEISAVAADVPVAFSIAVTGPVKIVKDAAHASGAVGGRPRNTGPLSVDAGAENARFLLLPSLSYPPTALERRISGNVEIEFKTTPTGEITDIKVRNSSGYADLDRAAIQNMRRGRWTGAAGFFVKKFVFILN
jgi:periplasmic protein TonB